MISLSLAWFYLLALLSSNIVWWPSGVSQFLRNCGVSNCLSISTVSSYCVKCMYRGSSAKTVSPKTVPPNAVTPNAVAPYAVAPNVIAHNELALKFALNAVYPNLVSLIWISLRQFQLIQFLLLAFFHKSFLQRENFYQLNMFEVLIQGPCRIIIILDYSIIFQKEFRGHLHIKN